jgi:hypothetical protein
MNCLADDRAVVAAKPHITDITAEEDWRARDGPIRVILHCRKDSELFHRWTTVKDVTDLRLGA